jgi:hypothetical protein
MSQPKTSSALGEVIDDSLAQKTGSSDPHFQERAAFSLRTKELRDSMMALCRHRSAKEAGIEHTQFDKVFKAVQDIWHREPHDLSGGDTAFAEVEKLIEAKTLALAEHLDRLEQQRLALETFDQRRGGLQLRIDSLVQGGFSPATTFTAALGVLTQLRDAGTATGDAVELAFTTLEGLIVVGEGTAEEARLYANQLRLANERLAELERNPFVTDGLLDDAIKALSDAAESGRARDHEGGRGHLKTASNAMNRVQKAAALAEQIANDRPGLLDRLVTRTLNAVKATREDVEDLLSEGQLQQLLEMQHKRESLGKGAAEKLGREMRTLYQEFMKAIAEQEEEDEEDATPPPPTLTAQQKRQLIHAAKLRRKSWDTLVLLDAEGEIFKTVRVFANQGADFKVGNTGKPGDYVKDWVEGWDVQIKRGLPTDPAGNCQYENMIVHLHYSDKNYSVIQRVHFKNSHVGKDHSHALVKTSHWGTARDILRRHQK